MVIDKCHITTINYSFQDGGTSVMSMTELIYNVHESIVQHYYEVSEGIVTACWKVQISDGELSK